MINLEQKEVLTINEFCTYTGISKSFTYKLTHTGRVPHYKPGGKMIYFKLQEVKDWLLSNRVCTKQEIESKASEYLFNKKPII